MDALYRKIATIPSIKKYQLEWIRNLRQCENHPSVLVCTKLAYKNRIDGFNLISNPNLGRIGIALGYVKNKGNIQGINISEVSPGSPADAAGIVAGDILTEVDGEPIYDVETGVAYNLLSVMPDVSMNLTFINNDSTIKKINLTTTRRNQTIEPTNNTLVENKVSESEQLSEINSENNLQIIENIPNESYSDNVIAQEPTVEENQDSAVGLTVDNTIKSPISIWKFLVYIIILVAGILFYFSTLTFTTPNSKKFNSNNEFEEEVNNDPKKEERTYSNPKDKPKNKIDNDPDLSWFEELGVLESASMIEISTAYKRKISSYHPDKVANLAEEFRDLAEKKSKKINAAYNTAKNLNRRS